MCSDTSCHVQKRYFWHQLVWEIATKLLKFNSIRTHHNLCGSYHVSSCLIQSYHHHSHIEMIVWWYHPFSKHNFRCLCLSVFWVAPNNDAFRIFRCRSLDLAKTTLRITGDRSYIEIDKNKKVVLNGAYIHKKVMTSPAISLLLNFDLRVRIPIFPTCRLARWFAAFCCSSRRWGSRSRFLKVLSSYVVLRSKKVRGTAGTA